MSYAVLYNGLESCIFVQPSHKKLCLCRRAEQCTVRNALYYFFIGADRTLGSYKWRSQTNKWPGMGGYAVANYVCTTLHHIQARDFAKEKRTGKKKKKKNPEVVQLLKGFFFFFFFSICPHTHSALGSVNSKPTYSQRPFPPFSSLTEP